MECNYSGWLVYHLGQRIENVREEHHRQTLLLVAGRSVVSLTAHWSVIFAATIVMQGQQLTKKHRLIERKTYIIIQLVNNNKFKSTGELMMELSLKLAPNSIVSNLGANFKAMWLPWALLLCTRTSERRRRWACAAASAAYSAAVPWSKQCKARNNQSTCLISMTC